MNTTMTALQLHILLWQREIVRRAQRAAALAGFLGIATLVAPAATHAQITSPERAVLNTRPFFSHSEVTDAAAGPWRTADGESALLGRSAGGGSSQRKMAAGTLEGSRPVDGERALLNKGARPDNGDRHLGPMSSPSGGRY